MSDEPETLTPDEQRVRALLGELRDETAPPELTRHVVHTARWQRPLRRALVAFGTAASAVAAGAGSSIRAYRRR